MATSLSLKTMLLSFLFLTGVYFTAQAATLVPVATKKEQRAQMKELRKDIRQHMHDLKSNAGDMSNSQVLAIIFAVILPPVGVLIHQGTLNNKFWLSLLLTLLIWLPGVIYSLLVVTGNA